MIHPTREIAATRITVVGICITIFGLYLSQLPASRKAGSIGRAMDPATRDATFKIGMGIAGIGIAIIAAMVVYVIFNHLVESNSQASQKRSGVRINTRFAQDEALNLMFPDEFDADIQLDWKFFLKLDFPDGSQGEFRCNPDLYFLVSEGQVGTVTFRGNWLESIEPDQPSHKHKASELGPN